MAIFRAMPYAKALHQVITTADPARADSVIAELETIADIVDTVPEFNRALTTPTVPSETKIEILEQVLKAVGISPEVSRLLHVVQQHYRMQHMRDIANAYRGLVDRALGRARATVEVATAVDENERSTILKTISHVIGEKIVAEFNINPELLAGLRFQVGSRVYDGSLSSQLDRLSNQSQIEQG